MSASREKKQRQKNAGLSEKERKAQQEQAARKRKNIIYAVTGAVIIVLVVALLVWRSGFFQARAAAATVGDKTLSAAELSYYYNNVRSTYVNYGIINSSTPDAEQIYSASENKTYRDYFLETALKDAREDLALAEEAAKQGHTADEVRDDLQANIDNMKAYAAYYGMSYKAFLKAQYGDYMTPSMYEKLLTRALMANLMESEKQDQLFDGYQQSDLDAYYKEHGDDLDTIEYSALYFAIATVDSKDKDGNDLPEDEVNKLKEEAKADAKEKAEAALEAVKGGATFQSQIDKHKLTGDSNADHTTAVGSSAISSAYREQLLKLGKDACELVETDNGYYVISFHSRSLSEEPTRNVRHILIRATHATSDNKLVPPTEEAWAAAKAKMDEVRAAWDASGKTEDDFAKLANEKSEDGGSNTNGGLYERVGRGDFVPEFNEWLFGSRTYGDVELIQHVADEGAYNGYYGYHLTFYVGEHEEPVWKGTARRALSQTDYQSWLEGLIAGYATAELSGANYLGK